MSKTKTRKKGRLMWGLIYVGAFLVTFVASAAFKMTWNPLGDQYSVQWDDSVGTLYTDLSYGPGEANKFDLYLPADDSRETYGLVVYLHAGGFTSGDKSGDAGMLQWLCAKGYVAAGINYTLFSEEHPDANVYTQSVEIRDSIPYVLSAAEERGYQIDRMAVSGGSAGHTLAMLYAYRDGPDSPVPVKLTFGAVGPSCFYPEDWGCFGLDQGTEESSAAAAAMFGLMAGEAITPEMIGTPAYDEAVKNISAVAWIDEYSPPTVCAYGAHDKVQAFPASKRLAAALEEHGVPHEYIVFPHSGHGLQNDNKLYALYMDKVCEYLDTYMGV